MSGEMAQWAEVLAVDNQNSVTGIHVVKDRMTPVIYTLRVPLPRGQCNPYMKTNKKYDSNTL